MSETLRQQINNLFKNEKDSLKPTLLSPCDSQEQPQYNQSRKVFNRKFDFMPSLIVKVKTTEQVSQLLAYCNQNTIEFTVRSGGHDHEGESVATGKILIDFSAMNKIDTNLPKTTTILPNRQQVMIQSGARFKSIAQPT